MELCPECYDIVVKELKLRLEDQCLKNEWELNIAKVEGNKKLRTFLAQETGCMKK